MACHLISVKPLSEPMMEYYWLDPWEHTSVKSYSQFINFHSRNAFENVVWKMAAILSQPQCVNECELSPLDSIVGIIFTPACGDRHICCQPLHSCGRISLFLSRTKQWSCQVSISISICMQGHVPHSKVVTARQIWPSGQLLGQSARWWMIFKPQSPTDRS